MREPCKRANLGWPLRFALRLAAAGTLCEDDISSGRRRNMTNRASEPQASMDVFEAVRTLLAVRSYQDKPVPDAVVRRIVEAGRLTGSAMNGQPWHFIVLRDGETLRRLGALASSGPYVAQAPLAIVVATEKTRFAVFYASRAIKAMFLKVWADGDGTISEGCGGVEW